MAIRLVPFVLLGATLLGLALPATRRAALWFLQENNPAELLTFVLCVIAGGQALRVAALARRRGLAFLVVAFYGAFGLGLLLVGMEEVAWGQFFFGWETPERWREINVQGETTLHNVPFLQSRTDLLRAAFGVGGLVGIWLGRFPALWPVAVPTLLSTWFWVITAHSVLDAILGPFYPAHEQLQKVFSRTSELVEMLVAVAGWLYVLAKRKELAISDGGS
jgi:hypothetical protein